MNKEYLEFIKWLVKNNITLKLNDDYIKALFGEFSIEYNTKK